MAFESKTNTTKHNCTIRTDSGSYTSIDVNMYFSVLYDKSDPSKLCPTLLISAYDGTGGYSAKPSSIDLNISINDTSVYSGNLQYRYRDQYNYVYYANWVATEGGSEFPGGTEAGLVYYNISNPKGLKIAISGQFNCARDISGGFSFSRTFNFDFPYKALISSYSFPGKIGGSLSFSMTASSSAPSGYSYKNYITAGIGSQIETVYSWTTTQASFSKTQILELSKIVPIIRDYSQSATYAYFTIVCETYYQDTYVGEDSAHTMTSLQLPSVSISQSGGLTVGVPGNFTFTADAELSSASCKYVLKLTDGTVLHEYNSSGNVSYTPPIQTFAPLMKSSLYYSINFYVYVYAGTVSDSNLVCSTYRPVTVTLLESDVAPTPTATVTDESGLYSHVGKYVSGVSYLNVSVDSGLKYGATMESIYCYVNGSEYVSNSFITNILDWGAVESGFMELTIYVTDSRGAVGTSVVRLPVSHWDYPVVSAFSVHRGYYVNNVWTADDNGNYVRVDWATNVFPVENYNTKSVNISVPSGTVTPRLSPSGYIDSGTVYSPANTELSFDITISVSDRFTTVSRTIRLSTAGVVMDFLVGGKGIGIGKVAETENCFEISSDWTLQAHNVMVGNQTLAEYIRSVVESIQ